MLAVVSTRWLEIYIVCYRWGEGGENLEGRLQDTCCFRGAITSKPSLYLRDRTRGEGGERVVGEAGVGGGGGEMIGEGARVWGNGPPLSTFDPWI